MTTVYVLRKGDEEIARHPTEESAAIHAVRLGLAGALCGDISLHPGVTITEETNDER